MRFTTSTIALAVLLAAVPAAAQAPAPGTSGAGSTVGGAAGDRTGSTTAVGQTKPPGAAVGDGLGTRPDLERKDQELTRRIERGICTGCD